MTAANLGLLTRITSRSDFHTFRKSHNEHSIESLWGRGDVRATVAHTRIGRISTGGPMVASEIFLYTPDMMASVWYT